MLLGLDKIIKIVSSGFMPHYITGGSGDAIIDNLTFDNVNANIGKAVIENVDVGEFFMQNVQIGDDADINSADFIIDNTVKYRSMSDGTIEKPIKVQ